MHGALSFMDPEEKPSGGSTASSVPGVYLIAIIGASASKSRAKTLVRGVRRNQTSLIRIMKKHKIIHCAVHNTIVSICRRTQQHKKTRG